jgi:DNA (cytosine-5)-methyltransferase 1
MTYGSLFAGIGGIDLALDHLGMQCLWQVELDDYCQKVLEKHWPHVEKHRDVKECGRHNLEAVDLICGGFPCQDISSAGRRVGIKGPKSGLWSEFARIVRDLRPRYVFIENVAALLFEGMGTVLSGLSSLGYDAEWDVLSAADVGAPHLRKRVWIVAYANEQGLQGHAGDVVRGEKSGRIRKEEGGSAPEGGVSGIWREDWWESESGIRRVATRVPSRVHRLKALGNAVVPQCAYVIAQRFLELEEEET